MAMQRERGQRRWLIGALAALAMVIPAEASAFTTSVLDSTAPGNRSVGRLFITSAATGTSRCSATVVDAPNQSTVITAGHCLNSATDGPTVSAIFVPGYYDGVEPFGRWNAKQFIQAPQWAAGFNRRYDYGFVVIARNGRRAVEDAVGGLPIAFNQPRAQGYKILGLPGEPTPPYDGSKLFACDTVFAGDSVSDGNAGPPRMRAGCDFGIGASGGPWLNGATTVVSVSSTKLANPPNTLTGPYLDGDAAALFATAGNISTASCKAKKKGKGKKSGASAAKKKKKKCKSKGR